MEVAILLWLLSGFVMAACIEASRDREARDEEKLSQLDEWDGVGERGNDDDSGR